MRQSAAEVEAITGTERADALKALAADRMAIAYGMSLEAARRYIDQTWPEAGHVVSPGQVWRLVGEPDPARVAFVGQEDTLTVFGVDRYSRMVRVGEGSHVHLDVYLDARYALAQWPAEFQPGADEPQAPATPIAADDESPPAEEDEPSHILYVIVDHPWDERAKNKRPGPGYLPMLGEHWAAIKWNDDPNSGYMTSLNMPTFIAANIDNYLAGWPEYAEQWRRETAWDSFNELISQDDEPEVDVVVAAYMGHWLWGAIRGDVVREHGNKDWTVHFMWSALSADPVVKVFPAADPTRELPADHDLLQAAGQTSIFELIGGE
jgi:hypothetical protein